MCGIAGQVRSDGSRVERSLVESMCGALEHRGPDSRGAYCEGPAGLGIQRLRVIDLITGDQPVLNEERSVVVVLNGEIYNYRELREGLRERGHRFASEGDTEVIAHLYEERGDACVEELHGMFAFALWDKARERLLLARDRLGKKPLYYSTNGARLSFASELQSLLQDPAVPREIDPTSIDEYFAYKYVPPPRTAFRDVLALPPAHTLVYERGSASIERYWRLRFDRPVEGRDGAELAEETRERLRDAVRRRLVSDVPLGAFLSGGVDSAAVVAAMAEASPDPVKTFSVGFEDEPDSELALAAVTARRFGTDHHELTVHSDALEALPRLVRHYGQPFADTSAVPSFLVAEAARRHVTVALNGDGGDESFAGYGHYVGALRTNRVAALPGPLRRLTAAAGRLTPRRADPRHPASRARRLAETVMLGDAARYADAVSVFTAAERRRLYGPGLATEIDRGAALEVIAGPWEEAGARDGVNRMLEVDVATYLPGDLLVKMDIASMACSLEARSPFLDHELMEFAATIPGDRKLRGGETKLVLRAALRGWIPDEVLDAPKRGFGFDTSRLFRGKLAGMLQDTVGEGAAIRDGWFDRAYVNSLIAEHSTGRADHAQKLWALMMFELWHREFIDRTSPG